MFVGRGLLALWNGVDPGRASEYDLWHTREHVPQRVSVPGMIRAFRYVAGNGPLPRYLTVYDLESSDVLTSKPYRHLLDNPTPWTLSMRPAFRGFLRVPCQPRLRAGGGFGSAILATTLRLPDGLHLKDPDAFATSALAIPEVVGIDLSAADPESPDVPFTIGGAMPDFPRDAVLILQGYDRPALARATERIKAWFADSELGGADTAWTGYALGFIVAHDDLPKLVTAPQQSMG